MLANHIVMKGYLNPVGFADSTKCAQIPINTISDFDETKVFIVEQDGGHYATISVSVDGGVFVVKMTGAQTDAVQFSGIVIS